MLMKKLNAVVYHKLLLQAEEAKYQGLNKLASGVLQALGPIPEDEQVNYNLEALQEDIYHGLWKLAGCLIKYHDLKSVDVERVHQILESLADKVVKDVKTSLNVENESVGKLEDKVLGEI